MDDLQSSFKKEFAADKILKKELDKQYREMAYEIQNIISYDFIDVYPEIFEIVLEKQSQTNEIVLLIKSKLQISLSNFLISHIHMMVNRQYTSKQRMYEAVIYDHLYRHYKMMEHRFSTIKEVPTSIATLSELADEV
jgi:hypothetical protein